MQAFAVVVDARGENEAGRVKARLEGRYGDVYETSPTSFVVASDGLTESVATAAGLKGDDRIQGATGVVFRIDGYSGYTQRSLWEWFRKVQAE